MDYVEVARSNYFTVKDPEAFKTLLGVCRPNVTLIGDGGNAVGFLAEEGFPNRKCTDEGSEDGEEFDFLKELASHLMAGEVAIIHSVGREGMRYLAGHAVAINSEGKAAAVDLSDIDSLAQTLTSRPEDITQCQY